jgi:hypothetical protein
VNSTSAVLHSISHPISLGRPEILGDGPALPGSG